MPRHTPFVPLSPSAARRGAALGALLAGTILGLALVPALAPGPLADALRLAFHAVCHQMPERSFHLNGHALAVCHRCTGIYAGLLAGSLVFPWVARWDAGLWRHARALIAFSLAPLALDWGGDALGLFANTTASQVLTGAFFGLGVSYLLARGLAGLFLAAPAVQAGADAELAATR